MSGRTEKTDVPFEKGVFFQTHAVNAPLSLIFLVIVV